MVVSTINVDTTNKFQSTTKILSNAWKYQQSGGGGSRSVVDWFDHTKFSHHCKKPTYW